MQVLNDALWNYNTKFGSSFGTILETKMGEIVIGNVKHAASFISNTNYFV